MAEFASGLPCVGTYAANAMTLATGIPGFFEPNLSAFLGTEVPLGCEAAGYYSTKPLERTLSELVDPALLNAGNPRLTVGAAISAPAQCIISTAAIRSSQSNT